MGFTAPRASSGDHTVVETPVPIPNTVAKHSGPMIVRALAKVGIARFIKSPVGISPRGFCLRSSFFVAPGRRRYQNARAEGSPCGQPDPRVLQPYVRRRGGAMDRSAARFHSLVWARPSRWRPTADPISRNALACGCMAEGSASPPPSDQRRTRQRFRLPRLAAAPCPSSRNPPPPHSRASWLISLPINARPSCAQSQIVVSSADLFFSTGGNRKNRA